jgi:hypothetical protein
MRQPCQPDLVDLKRLRGGGMASDDTNPPNPADQHPLRRCDRCAAEMKQLAELPALSIRAAVRVFRCYVCDHVVSDRA